MAAARNGSITTQERDQRIAESRQMRKAREEASDGQVAMTEAEELQDEIPFWPGADDANV